MATLNAQAIALLVEELLAAISAVGPLGVELYLKLQSLLHLGPDEQANVAAAIKAGCMRIRRRLRRSRLGSGRWGYKVYGCNLRLLAG
jgi:hypothetical protein